MGNLSNLYISQSFQSLAHLGTNNALVPGTMTQLEDGIGQSLNISFDGTNISSSGNIFAANLTGSASTGSFMLTGSVSVNVLTFTKADGSTFDLTVAASGSVVPGTISGSAQITALGFVSSSVTASSLITASFDNGTRNLTFTKGNNTTFNVNIPDVSGSTINTGSFVTTSSFNAYTSSTNNRLNNLESTSASVNVSISNLNSTTASQATSITNLNTFSASALVSISNLNTTTASLNTSASLALVTASFDNGTRNLTFTKGNTTQFSVNIPDASGSAGTTIFEVVYTGESITKGDPLYISGSQGANPIVYKADAADPLKMPVTFVSNETIGASNTTDAIILGLIEGINLTGYTAGQSIYVAEGGGWSASLPSGSNSVTQLLGVVTKGGSGGKGLVLNPGPAQLPGLDTGKMWVGNGNNQPIEITSASFASSASFNSYTSSTNSRLTNIESTTASLLIETQNLELFSASALISISNLNASSASQQISINNLNTATSSLFTSASLSLTTASVSGQTMTFTKGDGTTFNVTLPAGGSGSIDTASFATTGSNTFNGNQIISGTINTTQDITVSSVKFGFGNSAGTSSIAIGNSNTLQNNTFDNNIAIGNSALQQNTTGQRNTGIGTEALKNITGNSSYNTAIGGFALSSATSSTNTFALGYAAMELAETSTDNIAIGVAALYRKKANSNGNTAIGSGALREHYDGDSNTGQNMAFGYDAMRNVTSGSANTAIGTATLRDAARANENVFIGWISGINTSGSIQSNTVIGTRAGQKLISNDNTFIGHSAGSDTVNGASNTFIGKSTGVSIITGSSNTLIGANLSGVDNWSNVIAISDGAGAIKTKFQSDIWEFTGSVDIQNSLTASLQQGYVWVGNSAGRTVTVATSSFGGGGSIDTGSFATTGSNTFTGDQTLVDNAGNFFTISDASGSMMLVAKGFTSASAHMSASAAGIGNFIFKTNSNTADTIISGSGNIFVNGAAPTAGFKRYVGGSGNIALNGSNVPQISGSMAFSPTMNNNYFGGNSTGLTMRGPVSSSTYTISANNVLGTINIGSSAANHAEKAVAGLSMNTNIIQGTFNFIANRSTLTQGNTINANIITTTTLTAASSSIIYNNNIGGITITNSASGSATAIAANANAMYVINNMFGGAATTITTSGSSDPIDTIGAEYMRQVAYNIISGNSNSIRLPYDLTGSSTIHSTLISGLGLSITGSSPGILSAAATKGGSAFVGRFNQQDGNRAQTAQTVFAVGTGTSTSNRKTGFLIDSGSNTFVEGTLNVSGATSLNGNLIITGSLTASLQEGFVYVGNASGITTTVSTSSFGGGTIDTGSFATTGSNTFNGNQTITGSVSITGSLTTAGNMFQVTGSFNTFGNIITQLGVFTSSLAGGLEIDGIGYVGSGSAGAFFINSTTQDIKIQNYYSSSVNGKNIVIENFSQTGSAGMHGKVVLRARGTGGAVTVENSSQFRVECQTEITGSLIVSGSLAAANNIKMGRGTDKPTDKVTVGSGGLIVSNSLVTSNSYIFATNDTTVGNYSPIVSNITNGSFSLSNGGYGGNISVMYMIVNPY